MVAGDGKLNKLACAHASGMADPVGRPGCNRRSWIGDASQTCSGIMPPGLADAAIVSSIGKGSFVSA